MGKTYNEVEQAYKELAPKFIGYAKSHLINSDECIDVVHDTFEKILVYRVINPDKKIKEFYLFKELQRMIRRRNQQASKEIPNSLMDIPAFEEDE